MDSWVVGDDGFLVVIDHGFSLFLLRSWILSGLWSNFDSFMEWMPKWIFDGIGADHGLFSLFLECFTSLQDRRRGLLRLHG